MEVFDLAVVGGGWWGSASALEAHRAGKRVIVFDDADPMSGSRNASAIAHLESYSSPLFAGLWPDYWTKKDLQRSLQWLQFNCGAAITEERFVNLTRSDLPPRARVNPIYLQRNEDCMGFIPPVKARVLEMAQTGGRWGIHTSVGEFAAARVLVAAGYRSDDVLALAGLPKLGVKPLYGRGLIVTGAPKVPVPSMVMTRPYTKYAIRPWGDSGDTFRVGDTAERKRNDPVRRAELRKLAGDVLLEYEEVCWMEGWRPVLPKFTIELMTPTFAVATGGHRMSLGLTGLVAERVMKLLF